MIDPTDKATPPPMGLLATIRSDVRAKALWLYESDLTRDVFKASLTDGTAAMVVYRLMQWSRRRRLVPLELAFNKINSALLHCVIGRGAEFGPGLVIVHSDGVVINGSVRGGRGVTIEHQVTIGAEGRRSPVLGDGVFLGAGSKILGDVRIGDHARIGANAVVIDDVPDRCTAVGVPARIVRQRDADVGGFTTSNAQNHRPECPR